MNNMNAAKQPFILRDDHEYGLDILDANNKHIGNFWWPTDRGRWCFVQTNNDWGAPEVDLTIDDLKAIVELSAKLPIIPQ